MENACCSGPGFTCPITGFRFCLNRCFLFGAAIMVIWANLFSWLWHGNIMAEMYQQTAQLWRPPTEMIVPALNGGLTLMAIVATFIFMKGYEGRDAKEGLRFGILITLMFLGLGLITHATQPIPMSIIWMWTLGDLILYSVGGTMLAMYCKKQCKKS